jgi:hypothetical protein
MLARELHYTRLKRLARDVIPSSLLLSQCVITVTKKMKYCEYGPCILSWSVCHCRLLHASPAKFASRISTNVKFRFFRLGRKCRIAVNALAYCNSELGSQKKFYKVGSQGSHKLTVSSISLKESKNEFFCQNLFFFK